MTTHHRKGSDPRTCAGIGMSAKPHQLARRDSSFIACCRSCGRWIGVKQAPGNGRRYFVHHYREPVTDYDRRYKLTEGHVRQVLNMYLLRNLRRRYGLRSAPAQRA